MPQQKQVVDLRAGSRMVCDKQRFPVVRRGANGCFYWSQVYILHQEEAVERFHVGAARVLFKTKLTPLHTAPSAP